MLLNNYSRDHDGSSEKITFVLVGLPSYQLDLLSEIHDQCEIVLVIESNIAPPKFLKNDQIFQIEFNDQAAISNVIEQISAAYPVKAVLASGETSVVLAARFSAGLGLSDLSLDNAMALRNKYLMAKKLISNNVKTPLFVRLGDTDNPDECVEQIGGYPVISKPLSGFASQGVRLSNNTGELTTAIRQTRRENKFVMNKYYSTPKDSAEILIQQYIGGEEFAIDGFVFQNKFTSLAVAAKPRLSQGPFFDDRMHILSSNLTDPIDEKLKDVCQGAALALGINNSPIHIEVKKFHGQYYVIELAPRLGFITCLKYSYQINAISLALALKLGHKPQYKLTTAYSGSCCITPSRRGKFSGISNLDELLEHPLIETVVQTTSSHSTVLPPPFGSNYLAIVIATASSECQLIDSLDWAVETIDYQIN